MANLSETDILNFLKSVLKSVTLEEDDALVERLFSDDIPENRQDWLKVFTPSILSLKKNYERLEILGDTLLKTYFRDFLFYLNENYTESDITNLSSHYMARDGQSLVAIELGLTRHVVFPTFDQLPGESQEENNRILNKLRDNIAADIYESFIGAVATTSRRISLGLSELLCINIMRKIYSGKNARFPIEDKYRLSNVRTKIVQWLEGLGVPPVSVGATKVKTNEKNKTMFVIDNAADFYTVYLTTEQTNVLNSVLVSRGVSPFAQGFGMRMPKTGNYKVNIYYELEKLLTQKGVNQAFVDEYRISDGIGKVEGYRYVEVVTPKKLSEPTTSAGTGYAVYQLIGTHANGEKEILYTTCRYNSYYVRTASNGERKTLSRKEIMEDMVAEYRKKKQASSSSSSVF
jgi:dsRNA-specific ribonuclease